MLGHLELDTEVSDAGMETMESDDSRGVSRKDRDTNGMLAMMQKEARFPAKINRSLLTYLPSQSVDCVG